MNPLQSLYVSEIAGTRLIISQVQTIPEQEQEQPQRAAQRQDRRVLILVVTALEGVQNCDFPTCSYLATNLMLAASPQLQRITAAYLHMQGVMLSPPLATSFVCSVIVLFSRDPDAVRTSLAGECGHVAGLNIACSNGAAKGVESSRDGVREAEKVAENCLNRVLGSWITHVSAGQVCSRITSWCSVQVRSMPIVMHSAINYCTVPAGIVVYSFDMQMFRAST